jgi:ribonuclease HI
MTDETRTNLHPSITIYTDGGASPNPGPGGWAAILLHPQQDPQELSGADKHTTNNQMELTAAIEALQRLDVPHHINFYTDSQYLRSGITTWLPNWEARGWQTSQKQKVKNQDLWQKLAGLVKQHQIDWHWTKGHAGNKWNERADQLASAAIPKPDLPLDNQEAIHVFTGASYLGKTKQGGWSVLLRYRDTEKTLTGHEVDTSPNRMHLVAAIKGLEALKKSFPVHLYTPSSYLKDGVTQWTPQWQRRNWQTKEGKPVSNQDLWERLAQLTSGYQIEWHVVDKDTALPEMTRTKKLASEAAKTDNQ